MTGNQLIQPQKMEPTFGHMVILLAGLFFALQNGAMISGKCHKATLWKLFFGNLYQKSIKQNVFHVKHLCGRHPLMAGMAGEILAAHQAIKMLEARQPII